MAITVLRAATVEKRHAAIATQKHTEQAGSRIPSRVLPVIEPFFRVVFIVRLRSLDHLNIDVTSRGFELNYYFKKI